MATTSVDTRTLINENPFGHFQIKIFLICFLAVAIDGFDMQVIAVVASSIGESLHLQPTTLGIVIMSGQLGVMIGAIGLSSLADRMGRKRLMIWSCIIFGIFSLLTAFAKTVPELIVLRIAAGVGMGAIGPIALAYSAEYAPNRFKASIPSWIWGAGVPIGGVVAGLSAIWLLPLYGWQSVFAVAGFATLSIALILWVGVPESLAFLSTRSDGQPRMRAIAKRISPNLPPDIHIYSSDAKVNTKTSGAPVTHLFRGGRAVGTVLVWLAFFLVYGVIVFFISWIPTLIKLATGSTGALGTSLAFFNIGSLVATIVIGRLIDRFGYSRVLVPSFAFIALSMLTVGLTINAPLWMLLCAITALGAFSGSTCGGLMAFAANVYPDEIRSTGVGAAYGVGGRLGTFVAPILGGVLVEAHWLPSTICYAVAAPMLLGALAMLLLQRQESFRVERRT